MQYTPKTDEELEMDGLIPDGTVCNVEVKSSETYIGPTNKESVKVIFAAYHEEIEAEIWCFLTPNYARLWKHAIVAMVGQQEYEAGNIGATSFEYKHCKALIGIDEYKGKKKNVILDFMKGDGGSSNVGLPVGTTSTAPADDLPF